MSKPKYPGGPMLLCELVGWLEDLLPYINHAETRKAMKKRSEDLKRINSEDISIEKEVQLLTELKKHSKTITINAQNKP